MRKTQRFFCTNEQGIDLFYIELEDDNAYITMTLRCSIHHSFINNKHVLRNVRCIEERSVSDQLREEHFIPELFKEIQSIPGIEEHFLNLTVVDQIYSPIKVS